MQAAVPLRRAPGRVILLGCVKLKRASRAPARDLYISPLWCGRRAYAEACGVPWLILSAEHGLVDPEQPLDPYDQALAQLPAAARRAWGAGAGVVAELVDRYGPLDGITFEVHAGEAYRAAIERGIGDAGGQLDVPLRGLPLGGQLSWYGAHRRA